MGQVKYQITQDPKSCHSAGGFTDVYLYRPTKFCDERGFFEELYNFDALKFFENTVCQISRSINKRYVFRGMHWQNGMSKVMHVRKGSATLFAVDTRPNYEKKPHMIFLSERDNAYLYAPWWYARGFLAHEDDTEILYFQDECVNTVASGFHYKLIPDIAQYLSFFEPMMTISDKDRNAPLVIP